MTITTDEFLRRFLLHVLPRGFVRIRHFGFLSARLRRESVAVCRQLLAELPRPRSPTQTATPPALTTWPCPCCGGAMLIIEKLTAQQIRLRSEEWKKLIDSS
jgi:Putative transposase